MSAIWKLAAAASSSTFVALSSCDFPVHKVHLAAVSAPVAERASFLLETLTNYIAYNLSTRVHRSIDGAGVNNARPEEGVNAVNNKKEEEKLVLNVWPSREKQKVITRVFTREKTCRRRGIDVSRHTRTHAQMVVGHGVDNERACQKSVRKNFPLSKASFESAFLLLLLPFMTFIREREEKAAAAI